MIWRIIGKSGIGLLAACLVVSACSDGAETAHDADKAETETPISVARTASLGASCSGCHAATGTSIAPLTGLSHDAITQGLTAYRDNADGTTVMHRLARGYTDEEITAIANYLTNAKAK